MTIQLFCLLCDKLQYNLFQPFGCYKITPARLNWFFFCSMAKSCQVEIVPERAQAYLMFLSDHATDSGEEEFLATVIVSIQRSMLISMLTFFYHLLTTLRRECIMLELTSNI